MVFVTHWCKAHDTNLKRFRTVCDEKSHMWDDDDDRCVENVDLEVSKL
jgi:hypothetical protein